MCCCRELSLDPLFMRRAWLLTVGKMVWPSTFANRGLAMWVVVCFGRDSMP